MPYLKIPFFESTLQYLGAGVFLLARPGIKKKKSYMIKTTGKLVALLIVLTCAPLLAQDTIRFTTGLAVGGVHRYGREAIVQDHLALQLFTGKLQQPTAGQTL